MGTIDKQREARQRVASIARSYLQGKTSWQNFIDENAVYEGDSLIDELVDLIEHEPKRGGFMGLNEKQWLVYRRSVENAIESLEK